MAHILLVEDDELFAAALKGMIESCGHKVTLAANGTEAVTEIESQKPIDCIFSDLQMPLMSGIELAMWVRQNQPTPFIMMTGYFDEITTQVATDLGATNLLYKPFGSQEVKNALGLCLARPQPDDKDSSDLEQTFCKIPSQVVLGSAGLAINLYVKKGQQLVKVLSQGELLGSSPIYKELTSEDCDLWTEKSNLQRIIPMNLMVVRAALNGKPIVRKRAVKLLQRTSELLYKNMSFDGINEKSHQSTIKLIECLIEAVDDTPAFEMLLELEQCSDHVYANSMGVSVIGVMIAAHLKWPSQELMKVAISGILHDVGELYLDKKLVKEPWPLLSLAERARYQSHAELGYAVLIKTGFFAEEICQIVLQHHENNLGTGYPKGLKREQIHSVARLLRVADSFCDHVLRNPNSPGMPPLNALRKMEQEEDELDQEFFGVLKELFAKSEKKAG